MRASAVAIAAAFTGIVIFGGVLMAARTLEKRVGDRRRNAPPMREQVRGIAIIVAIAVAVPVIAILLPGGVAVRIAAGVFGYIMIITVALFLSTRQRRRMTGNKADRGG